MSLTEHHAGANATAVGLFAGLLDLSFDYTSMSVTKLVTALVVAFLTGAGYKLGSVVVSHLVTKLRKKP